METHVKHLFGKFNCLFNANQVLFIVILLHHLILDLLTFFQKQQPASLNVLHDEYFLLIKSLYRVF